MNIPNNPYVLYVEIDSGEVAVNINVIDCYRQDNGAYYLEWSVQTDRDDALINDFVDEDMLYDTLVEWVCEFNRERDYNL